MDNEDRDDDCENTSDTTARPNGSVAPNVAMIVAYGTERVPAHLADGRGTDPGSVSRPGAPAVILRPSSGVTLRLSDVAHPFTEAPAARDLSHAETQLACLEGHLLQLCGLWNRPLTGFVSAYFAALRAVADTERVRLEGRAGAMAGLIEPLHWCFAAPMPLPRAHVGLGEDGALSGSDAERTVMVDVLFQDGDGLVAVDTAKGSRTPRRLRDLDALADAGARVVAGVGDETAETLLDRLGPDFRGFADAVDVPQSPFRGRGIPAPVA